MKKITILLPCLNSIEFLHESVNSALKQTYENYDIHAYDNGSTDGSLEYLRQIEKENKNFTVHEVPNIYKNSFREAVDHSFQNIDTDYITFLCADDFLDPDYLKSCMKIISHNPEKIKCMQSHIVGVYNKVLRAPEGHEYKSIKEFKKLCMTRSPVISPSVEEAGAGDYDTFCNFADNNVFIYPVPKFLGYYYRWHEGQCTWSVIEEKKNINYDEIIQNYWREKWDM
jgi:glycosyltransferase involved in cell wall biosynthesis